MKTICIVHCTASLGGGTKSFFDIVAMLKNQYRIIACIPREASELSDILEDQGIETIFIQSQIPIFPYYSGSASLFSFNMFKSILSLCYKRQFACEISELKPDAVIFNTVISIISAPYLSQKVMKICFVRETFKKGLFSRVFYNILEHCFTGVCFLADHELQIANLHKPLVKIIPDCLEPRQVNIFSKSEARTIEGIKDEQYTVLFMGGISQIKGLYVALKAFDKLSNEYLLLIAGNFDEKQISLNSIFNRWFSPRYLFYMLTLRKYYFKEKKRGIIYTVGYRDDISTIMCACDVLVFPSTKAHQPRPCIEAGEYGKPVIISDYEATREYFIDGYNALTFKPNSANQLASKIGFLHSNPKLSKKLGDNNYLMTKEKHNFYDTNKQLLCFFNTCLEKDVVK